jgi:hypothetical protein
MTSWKALGSLILIGAATLSTFGGCTKAGPASNYPAPGASQGDERAMLDILVETYEKNPIGTRPM